MQEAGAGQAWEGVPPRSAPGGWRGGAAGPGGTPLPRCRRAVSPRPEQPRLGENKRQEREEAQGGGQAATVGG